MGSTKVEGFTEQQQRTAELLKALGHPARIAILEFIISKCSCICGDIVDELPLSQSTVSQHLKALKQAGIITGEIEGVKTCYCIDPQVWDELKTSFNLFSDKYINQNNCC